jgi:hypothetical protein
MIDVNEQDYLRVLRIGNLTLQELYDTLEDAREKRLVATAASPEQAPLPKRFTYFDCTDYIDRDDPAKPDTRNNWLALLTFAKWRKRYDAEARLSWYSHLHLLFAYVVHHQKPNVHGGYFEGMLSQELIYRLACLGYDDTVRAYGSEAALGAACEQKANPDAGVADAVGQSPRQRFGRTAQTGGRADADRTAGSTAARADRPRGSRSGRQVHCRGARGRRDRARKTHDCTAGGRCRAAGAVAGDHPAGGRQAHRRGAEPDPAGRRPVGTANVDRSGRCEVR